MHKRPGCDRRFFNKAITRHGFRCLLGHLFQKKKKSTPHFKILHVIKYSAYLLLTQSVDEGMLKVGIVCEEESTERRLTHGPTLGHARLPICDVIFKQVHSPDSMNGSSFVMSELYEYRRIMTTQGVRRSC